MRLVFVHGWALGPEMWDLLGPLLGDFAQIRVDLGFFGAARLPDFLPGDLLVGHSAGLLWGLKTRADWAGVIAINGFSRFALDAAGRGCVQPAALRAMQKSVKLGADACVARFRASIDAPPAQAPAQAGPLAEGLALLRNFDAAPQLGNKPALVLAAPDDMLVPPREAENLAQAASGRLVLSASGGHGLPWTAAEFCASQIEEFLRAHEF